MTKQHIPSKKKKCLLCKREIVHPERLFLLCVDCIIRLTLSDTLQDVFLDESTTTEDTMKDVA